MKKFYSLALAALVTLSGFAQTKVISTHEATAHAQKVEMGNQKMGKLLKKQNSPAKAPSVNPAYDTYTWVSKGTGTVSVRNLITAFYNLSLPETVECTIEEAEGHAGLYRLVNPWGEARPSKLIVDATNPEMVVLPYQSIPVVDSEDGQTYIASYSYIVTSDDEDFGLEYSAEDFIEFFPELNITMDVENKMIYIPGNSYAYYWPEATGAYAGKFFDGNSVDGYIVLPGGTYISPWIDLGMATFSESILTPSFGAGNRSTYQVQVLQQRSSPTTFQIVNPWKGLYEKLGFTGVSPTITIDASTPNNLIIPLTTTNISGGEKDGLYYVLSYSSYVSSPSSTPAAYRITYAETEESIAGKKYAVKTFTFPYHSMLLYASASDKLYNTGTANDTDPSTIVVKTEIIPEFTINFNVKDSRGNAAANATIEMTPEGGETETLTTDAEGSASTVLKGYYEGKEVSYKVSNVSGMLDYTGTFTISDLETAVDVQMAENPNKEFTFNFTVKDDEGAVVPNCEINVNPVISTPFTLTTNAEGFATKSLVGPYANSTVAYTINATEKYEAASGQFTVSELVTNATVILTVKHHDVAIAFTVVDNNNAPLAGANITVSDSEDQIVATVVTDENGYAKTAAFSDANGKVYSYTVQANKHEEVYGQITLLGYDTTVSPYTYNCPVMLTRMTDIYVIEFNVSNEANEAVEGAKVTLTEGEIMYGVYTTDSNGYAASAPLVKMDGKTLNFTIEAANYETYEGTVTVADYDDVNLPYYVVSDITLVAKGSGIDVVGADNGEVRYFNLQGVEIDKPVKGQLVIRVEGGKSLKQVVK